MPLVQKKKGQIMTNHWIGKFHMQETKAQCSEKKSNLSES